MPESAAMDENFNVTEQEYEEAAARAKRNEQALHNEDVSQMDYTLYVDDPY